MANRLIGLGLLSAGIVMGLALEGLRPEPVVSAQDRWQCRSWTLEASNGVDAVAPWLGAAERVQISTAGLAVANRYILVACKW